MSLRKLVLCLFSPLLLLARGDAVSAQSGIPWVRIAAVNGESLAELPLGDPVVVSALESVELVGGDDLTPPDQLVYLLQLVPVDAPGAILRDPVASIGAPLITAYRNEPLPPGRYVLRAQTRDADFNYSQMHEVPVEASTGAVATFDPAAIPWGAIALALLLGAALGAASMWAWSNRKGARNGVADRSVREELAFERHFNPYISGEPVRRPEMFFARRDLLNRIAGGLHQNSVMIQGERRIGKTSLLYQLADLLRTTDDPEWAFIPVMIDLEGTPQEYFFHLMMDATLDAARGYLPDERPTLYFHTVPAAQYSDRDFTADLRALLDALKPVTAPHLPRLVLMLDEVDVINGYDTLIQQQLRRILVSELSENVGAVVAGAYISKAWMREESPWYNLFYEIALEPFSDAEARRLLIEPVQGIYEWDPEALDYLINLADGRPHRLQQHALAAVNHMLAARRLRITLADVEAAAEAIRKTRGDAQESQPPM